MFHNIKKRKYYGTMEAETIQNAAGPKSRMSRDNINIKL